MVVLLLGVQERIFHLPKGQESTKEDEVKDQWL